MEPLGHPLQENKRIGQYHLTKKLGSGMSAETSLANTQDGGIHALKILDLSDPARRANQ